jgi:hypothetical protein
MPIITGRFCVGESVSESVTPVGLDVAGQVGPAVEAEYAEANVALMFIASVSISPCLTAKAAVTARHRESLFIISRTRFAWSANSSARSARRFHSTLSQRRATVR